MSNERTWVCLRATRGAHNDDEKADPLRESFLRLNEIKWHNLSGTRRNSSRIHNRSDLKSEIEKGTKLCSYGFDLEKPPSGCIFGNGGALHGRVINMDHHLHRKFRYCIFHYGLRSNTFWRKTHVCVKSVQISCTSELVQIDMCFLSCMSCIFRDWSLKREIFKLDAIICLIVLRRFFSICINLYLLLYFYSMYS